MIVNPSTPIGPRDVKLKIVAASGEHNISHAALADTVNIAVHAENLREHRKGLLVDLVTDVSVVVIGPAQQDVPVGR